MYYEAYIFISTVLLWLNPDTGDYEGCDPDSYQDHGTIDTIRAPSLAELKAAIERRYFSLDNPIGADVQIFENRIEIQYQGEHDYRTPKAERIPFIETATITIAKITTEEVDLSSEMVFAKVPRC